MATSASTLPIREKRTFGKELKKDFLFDEKWLNLNHGSFGTYPRTVQNALRAFQDQSEARVDQFMFYDYAKFLDESRAAISTVLKAPIETLVFVPNATTGVNTVLRNLVYEKGDKILYFASIYGSCEKTVVHLTETTPAEAVKIEFEYPVEDDWLVSELERKIKEEQAKGGRVKVAIFDIVVSIPGVRMPFERLTKKCNELGVLSLIDGAHGVGHIDLNLGELDPDFFVSNCHKWLYVPRGCAIFYVPVRNQEYMRTTFPTSHGFVPIPVPGTKKIPTPLPSTGVKSAFVQNFEFMATIDNTPYFCVPAALEYRQSLGGEKAIMEYCSNLARTAAQHAAKAWGTEVLENSTNTLGNCCMSNIRLPLSLPSIQQLAAAKGVETDGIENVIREWISRLLVDEYQTFIMMRWYAGAFWVRYSGQIYLEASDFEWGTKTLSEVCERVMKGEFLGKGYKEENIAERVDALQ